MASGQASPALSIVVPCFNDAPHLAELLRQVEPVLAATAGGGELVLVDDGSRDGTAARARELAADYPHSVTVVRLARNFGQHPAVFAGLEHARGDVVVTMDSDLQYPPSEIVRLVALVDDDHPVVSGVRTARKDPFPRRLLTQALTRWLNRQTGARLQDFGSMFRAYRRDVVVRMLSVTERHRYVPAVVASLGVAILEVPVEHRERGEQGSRYRIGRLVELLMDAVTGYAIFPLRVLTFLGLAGALFGIVASLLFLVYRVFEGSGVSGTVSAFALVFFLLAVQLAIVALLGEYVGRIYVEAKGRPYYVVADVSR